jgi:hypothetical protein
MPSASTARAAAGLAVAIALSIAAAVPTQAAVTFTFAQVGSDVVISASGSLDTASMQFLGNYAGPGILVSPSEAAAGVSIGSPDFYYAPMNGQTAFGPGGFNSSGCCVNGGNLGFNAGDGVVAVSAGYVSGSGIATEFTFHNHSFATLGVTPGTYVWEVTSATGSLIDTITLEVPRLGSVEVPEPASMALFGFGLLGMFACGASATRRHAA